MTLNPKTIANQLAAKIVVCCGVLVLGFGLYSVGHSSARRLSKPQRASAMPLIQPDSGENRTPALQINSIIQHGRIVEIQGSTDPGAVIMINGQDAPTLFGGNSFKHFIGPLHAGTAVITITAQDSNGGVNTQQMAFTIQ